MALNVNEFIGNLGKRGRDKITGVEGIITSACFDLYGCAQYVLNRGMDKDGKPLENNWYDYMRIEILRGDRVMEPPPFDFSVSKGPETKPVKY